MGLRETLMEAKKQRTIKEQLFEVILGWLFLLVLVGLLGFFYGMLFSEAGYVLTLDQISPSALFTMSWAVIVPVALIWWQIKRTKKVVTSFRESD